ncbi:MAG: S8 family serine peptidase, partial [Candidatus Omnitrophica bacterium]|nr:S8 family serine peptidase [Candidatus Omnitrophota bacterium]
MKSYNYRLKLLGIILGLILITPLHSQAKDDNTDTLLIQAQPRIGAQGAKAAAPQYVPGQFIVKLKEGKAVTDIQDLNVQFKVTVVKEVFEKTPSPEEELQQLNAKLANLSTSHSSWFWQLDKNSKEYKEYMAKLEQEKAQLQGQIKAQEELIVHLAERQQRAPEGVVTPNLENTYLLKTASEADIRLVIAAYQGDPNVEYAEPNYIGKAQLIPNDPRYKDQWSHKTTHAEEGWNITTGTPKVVIAIIDTGVDYTHEDLKDNIWKDPLTGAPGKDFVDIDTNAYEKAGYTLFKDADGKYKEDYIGVDDDPADYLGHGTMVAGVAAAKGNNSIGIAGVCYNCKIMPVRTGFDIITPDMGFSPTSKIETALSEGDTNSAAIRYAADKGADVINMSFSETGSNTLKSAIDYAHAKGVVLVACAGNDGNSKENFPAASEGVIAVGATEKDDSLSWYSNYGDWVDVVAPGTQILSCVPKTGGTLANSTGYHYDIGTSFSTPYVSGVAG